MARIDVLMPQMGESIAEGTLSKWLKKLGDPVKRDEPLFEISTDKVDAEIPAPTAGTLAEIKVQEGQTVPVMTLVAVIETEAGAAVPTPTPPRRLPRRLRLRSPPRPQLLQRWHPSRVPRPPSHPRVTAPRRPRNVCAGVPPRSFAGLPRSIRWTSRKSPAPDSRVVLPRPISSVSSNAGYQRLRHLAPDPWHLPVPSSIRPRRPGPVTGSSRGPRSARSRPIT